MNFVKVNNRTATRTFDGLLNDLFGNFENVVGRDFNGNVPPVNIAETAEGYHLEFAAPGRNKENFKLKVEGKLLTISYEDAKTEEAKDLKQVRKEFTINAFKRSFTLDEKTNAEGILAKYEDGILKVFVPKKEEVKPAVTEITVG
ncbi:MAG: Hsp20/alpha crystallin family protein [Bacteroidota bacterium]